LTKEDVEGLVVPKTDRLQIIEAFGFKNNGATPTEFDIREYYATQLRKR
jgi:hypothetical protein